MKYKISHPSKTLRGNITLTASKSESNRALIIQALCSEIFTINNLAAANDTAVLQNILKTAQKPAAERVYNVEDAGTAIRFLTAFFATQPGTHTLLCSEGMKVRPIGILVEALRSLGAKIEYLEKPGFPPLKITGTTLSGTEVEIDGNVSSQFISALLLIAPRLPNGLVIKFKGEVTSRPYINMTLKMMEEFRVYGQWHDAHISVSKQNYHKKNEPGYQFEVEADWSSASYWYAIAALARDADFIIKGLKHPSLQGDAIVADLFTFFGIKTDYIEGGVHLTKTPSKKEHFSFDFSDCPDLAQTVAVVASATGIPMLCNGVHTLRIKETDRIEALKKELQKLNVEVLVNNDNSIEIIPKVSEAHQIITINTYNDHRMALAFASLAMKYDHIIIDQPEVVKKSYPDFWKDLKSVGFIIEELQS
ncbi:MAG: 3-phosphoshikimate 1-carboxyvinyltransferase [Bacteroidia bacterium]|jgi:3-phosphoshikimate 1-carboxyvinyltransferase